MEIKTYIESGILEAFVAGQLTEVEALGVVSMRKLHLEINEEIISIEAALQLTLEELAVTLDPETENKIFSGILDHINADTLSEGKVVNINNLDKQLVIVGNAELINAGSRTKVKLYSQLSIAALLLLGLSAGTNFYLYNKLNDTSLQLADAKTSNSIIANNLQVNQVAFRGLEAQTKTLASNTTRVINLNGLAPAPNGNLKVSINPTDQIIVLSNANLPAAPEGKQYQIWAIVDGKPVDMGLMPSEMPLSGTLSVKYVGNATAFAVTLEDLGGHPQPKGTMYLMGAV